MWDKDLLTKNDKLGVLSIPLDEGLMWTTGVERWFPVREVPGARKGKKKKTKNHHHNHHHGHLGEICLKFEIVACVSSSSSVGCGDDDNENGSVGVSLSGGESGEESEREREEETTTGGYPGMQRTT